MTNGELYSKVLSIFNNLENVSPEKLSQQYSLVQAMLTICDVALDTGMMSDRFKEKGVELSARFKRLKVVFDKAHDK